MSGLVGQQFNAQAGAGLKASGLNPFGRLLANMEGLERKRTKSGTVYRVRRK